MVQFILGASGTGKTTKVHEMIEKISENEESKIMLIVPEQFTFETEKTLFKKLGGDKFMRVNVTSFTRFASEVFKLYGGVAGEYASEPAKAILMDMAIHDLKDNLDIYKKASKNKSFSTTMLETINELKNAGVTPEKLSDVADNLKEGYLADKTKEIALVYETYNALLYSTYIDSLDDINRATKKLKDKDYFKDYIVFFDEFKGFTSNENDLIKMIFQGAKDVYVSLCLDLQKANESDISVFTSVKYTYQKLIRFAKQVNVSVKPSIKLSEQKRLKKNDLIHLEQNIFSPVINEYDGDLNSIKAMLCVNEYDEVDYVMSSIVDLIQNDNYRYNDIVIISRDLDAYITKLQVAFQKYKIPYYSDTRSPITNKPLIRFINNAIKCINNGLQSEDILGLLKSGLTRFSIEEVAELENYIYIWDIKGKQWYEDFTLNPSGYKESFSDYDSESLQRINTIRGFIANALIKLRENTRDVKGNEICKAILEFLIDFEIDVYTKILVEELFSQEQNELAEDYIRIWDIFIELLDIMATTINENKITFKRFEQLYQLVCNCYDMGTLPQSLDCVIVGSADRIRTSTKKAVFILGVNENVFPLVPSSSGMFTDKEREELISFEIDISPPVKNKILEERFIAYKTLSSPTEKLYLTARKADIKGKAMLPSIIFPQLKKMFGKNIIGDTLDIDGLFFCKTKPTAFSYLAKTYYDNNELTESLKYVLAKDNYYFEKINTLESVANKKPFVISKKENASELFGKTMNISPTRVEGFYQCQFKYFCEHGLRIYPLRKAELNPLETGTLIHTVLYNITKELNFKQEFVDEKIKQIIKNELNSYIQDFMGGEKDKTERFLYLYNRMENLIFKVIKQIYIELSQSEFKPCDFEYEISNNSEVKPLVLETKDKIKIIISGKIDRIDCYINKDNKKYIRVVDYKSGKKQFALNDVLYGLNLQMLIYLFCIKENGKGKYKDCFEAGILYMPAGEKSPTLPRDATNNDKDNLLIEHYKMNGLLLNDKAILSSMEKDLKGNFVPVSTKKDGDFTKQSLNNLVTDKEFEQIKIYINKLIENMAENLHQGNINAFPIEGSCEYCSYNSICARKGDDNFKEYIKYDKEEILKQMNSEEEKDE